MTLIVIAAGIVIVVLCVGLVLFMMETRRHRRKMLDPGSYRFGMFGMVVYLVMYNVLTIIERICVVIGKAPRLDPDDYLYFDPAYRNSNSMNVFRTRE